jgi:hypothetical protein
LHFAFEFAFGFEFLSLFSRLWLIEDGKLRDRSSENDRESFLVRSNLMRQNLFTKLHWFPCTLKQENK